jgi:hypothetical protein
MRFTRLAQMDMRVDQTRQLQHNSLLEVSSSNVRLQKKKAGRLAPLCMREGAPLEAQASG